MSDFYAPNFEKCEGAYCFGLVRPSVCTHEWTLVGYYKFPKFYGLLPFANLHIENLKQR